MSNPTTTMVYDYPEPPEPQEKLYKVKLAATIEATCEVYAKNYEEVRNILINHEFDRNEIELESMEIEDILDIEEV